MTRIAQILLTILMISSSVSYFKYQRPLKAVRSGQQYITVDDAIWQHARPDLGDLRLYNGQTEVPYAFVTERGGTAQQRKSVRVFQQSNFRGKTQFFLDMRGLAKYDHVALNLSTRNFVAHAHVEGQDDVHATHWAGLGESILYDLSRESLGGNTVLRLPRASYRYLRVTIEGPVKPEEVIGANSEQRQEQKALWRRVGGEPQIGSTDAGQIRWEKGRYEPQSGKDTVLLFQVPQNVPVERIVFDVDAAQPNFRREVRLLNDKGVWLGSGEIDRVHIVRSGETIDSDNHEVNVSIRGEKTLAVIVANGDDPPLTIRSAHLEQQERRIYFDAAGGASLMLYYGDESLNRPVYDYSKFFQQQREAVQAQLGVEQQNAAYAGRPDDRPWSDRHPAVLWIAIVGAVLVLGGLAVKSMRSAATQ
jgi:uncharacterized protein DUF3999